MHISSGSRRRALLVALAIGLWASGATSLRPEASSALPGTRLVSLLATGDTGRVVADSDGESGQRIVARALEEEDRRAPVDALVLLGDNFYPKGLRWDGIVSRVRDNLVSPYCRFVTLDGPLSDKVSSACSARRQRDASIPIYAVLGNHDHKSSESALLERHAVPWFISNWSMPDDLAETFDIGGRISLIAIDSTALRDGADARFLTESLRAAPGPWRILLTHHPVASSRDEGYARAPKQSAYQEAVESAIAAAGVPVHLILSGHDHVLAATRLEPSSAPLNVVVGSGSEAQNYGTPQPDCVQRWAERGFARVDLVQEGGADRLVVSIFATPPRGGEVVLASRWEIGVSGNAVESYRMTGPLLAAGS